MRNARYAFQDSRIESRNLTVLDWVALFCLVLGALFSYPAILGNISSLSGTLLTMLGGLLFLISRGSFKCIWEQRICLLANGLFWVYIAIQPLLLHENSNIFTVCFHGFVISVACFSVHAVVLRHPLYNRFFFRMIFTILAFCAASYVVTSILRVIPQNFFSIYLFRINDPSYPLSGNVYFPFTIVYNAIHVMGYPVFRLQAIMRESGITQFFYIWGFVMARHYFKHYNWMRMMMLLGVIVCFSTAGYLCLALTAVLYLMLYYRKNLKTIFQTADHTVSWKKITLFCSILLASGIILFVIPGIRLQDKALASLMPRLETFRFLKYLVDAPWFGIGYGTVIPDAQVGINFIGNISQIGLVGVVLYGFFWWSMIRAYGKDKLFWLANSAFIITFLFSQPLICAPLSYVLLLGSWACEDKSSCASTNENQ